MKLALTFRRIMMIMYVLTRASTIHSGSWLLHVFFVRLLLALAGCCYLLFVFSFHSVYQLQFNCFAVMVTLNKFSLSLILYLYINGIECVWLGLSCLHFFLLAVSVGCELFQNLVNNFSCKCRKKKITVQKPLILLKRLMGCIWPNTKWVIWIYLCDSCHEHAHFYIHSIPIQIWTHLN